MKTIKIKYVGFWNDFDYRKSVLYNRLIKYYDVQVTDEPDYIICSVFGKKYEYCKYPQVRIMDVGENYIPDFNLVDYGISSYPLTLQDRSFHLPICVEYQGCFATLSKKDKHFTIDDLDKKPYFANFIFGHESEDGLRGDFFKELCKYKRVESPGTYLNNMPNGETVKREGEDSKFNFQKKCKFTLCFESTKHEGFVTEKITEAFYTDTIPVYFGSEEVKNIFNEDAFIYVNGRDDFKVAIDRIIELDKDDEKYIEMLNKPILKDNCYYEKKMAEYDRFIRNIFDQPIDKAYRRSRVFWGKIYNDYFKDEEYKQGLMPVPKKKDCILKRALRKAKRIVKK